MRINFSTFIIGFCILFIASCSKDEGQGGTSTIKGKIRVKKYDTTFNILLEDYYSPDEDVYIIYGDDHTPYDDDYKTSYDGTYEFKYLQKGTYKIFCYTIDTTGLALNGFVDENLPKIPVFQTVTISDKGKTIEAPEIVILKKGS